MRKPVMPYANNKGADQPAHPRRLISTFAVRYLDSIIPILTNPKIPRVQLAYVAEQAGLSCTWSKSFLMTRLRCYKNSVESFKPIKSAMAKERTIKQFWLTLKLLKIQTLKKYTVIILNFDSYGFSIGQCVQTMQTEWQTM